VAPVCATMQLRWIQATQLLCATASTLPGQFMHTCFAASAVPARFLRAVLAGVPHLALKSGCTCKPWASHGQPTSSVVTVDQATDNCTLACAHANTAGSRCTPTRNTCRGKQTMHSPCSACVYGKPARLACARVCQLAAQAEAHCISQKMRGHGHDTGCCVAPFAMFARALLMMCASTATCPWLMNWLWL
jgi:hypothetical protein